MIGVIKSAVVKTMRRNTFSAGAGKKRIKILLRQGAALGLQSHLQIFVKFRT
jgi:hypothetical protein